MNTNGDTSRSQSAVNPQSIRSQSVNHPNLESSHEKNKKSVKKPSTIEKVDGLIKQKAEETVHKSAKQVQGEVADLMSGVEAPSQTVSEKKGESGERGDIGGGSGVQQDDQQAPAGGSLAGRRGMPSQEVMIKKIRTAINLRIKYEQKKAKRLKKHLATGSAQEYNTAIARIRRLQETLTSLLTSTFDVVKGFYSKYFNANGRRKAFDEA